MRLLELGLEVDGGIRRGLGRMDGLVLVEEFSCPLWVSLFTFSSEGSAYIYLQVVKELLGVIDGVSYLISYVECIYFSYGLRFMMMNNAWEGPAS